MTDQNREALLNTAGIVEPEQRARRNFLLGLGKWSKAVIGGVVMGGLLAPGRDANAWGWANRNGGSNGSWVNFRGGGWGWGWGPGWFNRPGRWYNNPGWFNRGGWHNGGWNNGGWNNGGWFNGPGWGGSWVNR